MGIKKAAKELGEVDFSGGPETAKAGISGSVFNQLLPIYGIRVIQIKSN
jgi:hypothetical protein